MARVTLLALAVQCAASMSVPWVTRRSVAKYDVGRAVPTEIVSAALDAAVLAPCHFLTEPWRFYECGPETRAKLCALNEEKKAMFEGVPGWCC